MKKITSLLIFCCLSFSGCNKAEDKNSQENQISQANQYIDQGQYSSAIQILEESLQNNDSERARMTLASAYAGRSGIRVETYFDFLVGFDAFVKNKKPQDFPDLISQNQIPEGLDERGMDFIRHVNKQHKELKQLQKRADKIPSIGPSQRSDLARARVVITNVTTPGSKLYRALLAAIILKSEVVRGELLIQSWSKTNFNFCKPEAPAVATWLWQTLSLISDGLNDAGQAYPENNVHYQTLRKDLILGMNFLQAMNTHQTIAKSLCPN
ncbi:MAG: hypothetical protein ACK5P5_04125 [Pseudobdellovibrionaceae bacterium]